MKKLAIFLLVAVMAGMLLLAGACTGTDEPDNGAVTEQKSRDIAEQFVRNSPTFVFDGIPATLKLAETVKMDKGNTWQFVFLFESANAGYGDRTGQMVAEVITPHEAVITVANGVVTSAVMDGVWDMMTQKMIDVFEIKLAPIHEVTIAFLESYPVQIMATIQGGLSDGCTTLHDIQVDRDGETITITVTTQRPRDTFCPAVYTYFEENIHLGTDFTSGTSYTVNVNDFTTTFIYP